MGVAVYNLFGVCPGGREISTWIINDGECSEAKNCLAECEFRKIKKEERREK